MGLARNTSPDPRRAGGLDRPSWPTRPPSPASVPMPSAAVTRRETVSGSRSTASTPAPSAAGTSPPGRQPKPLDRLREALRARHYSPRTEQTYRHWVKRYIFFHHGRHPAEMAEPEINAFLTHLAVKEKVSASTQNRALSALRSGASPRRPRRGAAEPPLR